MAGLLDIAIKASVLLVAAGAGIGLMRRASAASRHLAWTAVLSGLVLMPLARLALPDLTLFVLPAEAVQTVERNARGHVLPTVDLADTNGPSVIARAGAMAIDSPSATPMAPARRQSWPLSSVLVGVWVAGAAGVLLKTATGALRARRLARQARPASEERLRSRLASVVAAFGVRRPVALLISAREWMPATWGILRPAILLPASATGWIDGHPDRLDAVLVHETAHIARFDAASQLIARLAVALHWFNPLVWLAVRQARLERERACDDAVLASGMRPSEYAGDLLALAQSLVPPALTSSSALAMARRSQLDRRIHALLDDRVNRRGVSRPGRLVAAGLVFAMLPVAAARLAARPAAETGDSSVQGDLNLSAVTDAAQASAAQTSDGRLAVPPVPAPQATTAPQTPPSPLANVRLLDQAGKWRLERTEMGQRLLQRARSYLWSAQARVETGTAVPADLVGPETTFASVERATAMPALRHGEPWVALSSPSDAEIATVRNRVAEALRDLDAVLTRFDSGVVGTADVDAAFKAAVAAFTDPPAPPTPPGQQGAHPIRFVTRSGTNTVEHRYDFATMGASGDSWQWQPEALPDADLIAALKNAATMPDDTKRADMLLLLARGNAFTPEMVALYVAAANGITSETERARVFAQPIRIKPVNPTVASVTAPTTNTTINLTPKNRLQGSYYWQRFNNTPDTLNSAAFNGQATEMFTSQNFPGASTQDLNNARKLYELLTGRVQSIEDEFAKGTVPENTGGLTKPVARQKPLPKYTPGAMRQKIQGDVLVDVVVGTDGTVMRARIAQSLDPDYGLDESALATAKQWTFEPGVLKGEKVPVLMRLVLTFSLH